MGQPQPFWREQNHCYYAQIGKKQHSLSPDREEAYRLYHQLMSTPAQEPHRATNDQQLFVIELLDMFLAWCQATCTPRTDRWRRENLETFAKSIPCDLTVIPVADVLSIRRKRAGLKSRELSGLGCPSSGRGHTPARNGRR